MAKHFKTSETPSPESPTPETPSSASPAPEPRTRDFSGLDALPSFDDAPEPVAETRATVVGSDYVSRERVYRKPAEPTPTIAEDPFVPVVSETAPKKKGRRAKDAYPATDPYDIKGVREGKNHNVIRIISNILFVVGIGLLLVALGMWGKTQWDYHQQDVAIEKLQGYAHITEDASTAPVVDWSALKAVNPDVVGWIQIPGTGVNYPVYYGESNEEYLRTNAEGEYAVGGEVFLDYLNTAPGMTDQQTIIYGHHLYNGTMFKPVADMDSQQMFDSVDTVWYVTENQSYELEPLFLYYTDPYDEAARTFTFGSDEEFHTYLQNILVAKGQTRRDDVQDLIGKAKHVLTLATCNYYDNYGRTLLVCIPKAEAQAQASAQ